MNGDLGHNSPLYSYTGLGTTWANKMKFGINDVLGAKSTAWPVDQQPSAISLCHG